MAINTRGPVDPRWINYNLGPDRALRFATINIVKPNSESEAYNASTNTWTKNVNIIWTGKARIQAKSMNSGRRGIGNTITGINPSVAQIVEVSIGLRENQLLGSNGVMPDIRPGYKMVVTDSPFDASLVNFDFTVRSVINSSNPWHRQILCEVNEELNTNNV